MYMPGRVHMNRHSGSWNAQNCYLAACMVPACAVPRTRCIVFALTPGHAVMRPWLQAALLHYTGHGKGAVPVRSCFTAACAS